MTFRVLKVILNIICHFLHFYAVLGIFMGYLHYTSIKIILCAYKETLMNIFRYIYILGDSVVPVAELRKNN